MEVPNPTARVRFGDWFSEAWGMLTAKWQTWLAISALLLATVFMGYAVIILFGIGDELQKFKDDPVAFYRAMLESWYVLLLIMFVVTIIQALFVPGIVQTAFKQMRNEPITLSDMFTGYDRFADLVVGMLLVNLASLGFQSLLSMLIPIWGVSVLVGFIVQGLCFLVIPLVVHGNRSALDALRQSVLATRRDLFMFSLFALTVNIVIALGVLACCVGMVFLFPMLYISMAIAYRDFFESEVRPLSAVDELYTKYCKQCGNALPVRASFCDKCGASQV